MDPTKMNWWLKNERWKQTCSHETVFVKVLMSLVIGDEEPIIGKTAWITAVNFSGASIPTNIKIRN